MRQARKRQLLFVQGGGEGTHDAWDDKLVASLERALGPDYTVHYPRMPNEAEPQAAAWKKAIGAELRKLSDDWLLVGHSVGAAILLDHLADAKPARRIAGLFLIAAPFIGDGGWPSEELRPTREVAAALGGGTPLTLYRGDDDETVPASHIELYAGAFPAATIRRLPGRDHQLGNDLSEVARDIERLVGKRSVSGLAARRSRFVGRPPPARKLAR